MKFRKVIKREFRNEGEGTQVAGGLNAAVDINVGESGEQHTHVSSHHRIVQRSGKSSVTTSSGKKQTKSKGRKPGKEER